MPKNEIHYSKKIKRANLYVALLVIIIITVIAMILVL